MFVVLLDIDNYLINSLPTLRIQNANSKVIFLPRRAQFFCFVVGNGNYSWLKGTKYYLNEIWPVFNQLELSIASSVGGCSSPEGEEIIMFTHCKNTDYAPSTLALFFMCTWLNGFSQCITQRTALFVVLWKAQFTGVTR